MPDQNFRVQLTRGTTAEADAYVGREGELTVDLEAKNLRVLDGSTPGGAFVVGGADVVKIEVNNFSSGNIDTPAGVTVQKEYNDSSLRITHNKGKVPINWFGINKVSNPNVGIYPTSTLNIQIIDNNEVIITNVKDFETAEFNLIF